MLCDHIRARPVKSKNTVFVTTVETFYPLFREGPGSSNCSSFLTKSRKTKKLITKRKIRIESKCPLLVGLHESPTDKSDIGRCCNFSILSIFKCFIHDYTETFFVRIDYVLASPFFDRIKVFLYKELSWKVAQLSKFCQTPTPILSYIGQSSGQVIIAW